MYEEKFSEIRIIIDPIGEIPKNIFVVDRLHDNDIIYLRHQNTSDTIWTIVI